LCFGSLDFVYDGPVESPTAVVFARSQPDTPAATLDKQPESRSVKSVANQVLNLICHDMVANLGPNPSQKLFRAAAYTTTMLALRMQDDEMLSWDEFKLYYDAMYPEGQTWLPYGGTGNLATGIGHGMVPSEASVGSCVEANIRVPLPRGR
jgi:hypothetical protein